MRERELKLDEQAKTQATMRSLPMRERELKLLPLARHPRDRQSLPMRERELKLGVGLCLLGLLGVAPHAGA